MKAIAVKPRIPNSVHLAELPKPRVTDVPNGRGVLVKVLKVGVDATDREINDGLYGNPPPGYDFLVLGHESFGIVEEVGPSVRHVKPGDYVTCTAPARHLNLRPYRSLGHHQRRDLLRAGHQPAARVFDRVLRR